MNTILNLFKPEAIGVSVKENQDPVPAFIDKLSSGEDLKIKIQTSNDNIIIQNKKKFDTLSIPYSENKKSFQFPKLQKCFSVFSNKRSPNFPTKEQKSLLSKLKQVPVYTVVNKQNELVTASTREYKNSHSLDWIQSKYNEIFFWEYDEGSVSINLFFMNKEDAASYLHEICKKEPKEAENLGLKIKTIGLDVFYKLNRTSAPKTQNRLVGDLKEIDVLLTKYSSESTCTIHPKQKYSRDWFQGNPIYVLKFHKNLRDKTITPYSFQDSCEKKLIFFSKEDAIKAWKVFLMKKSQLSLNTTPSIEIYNLENFLIDLENAPDNLLELSFIPPYKSYTELKSQNNQKFVLKSSFTQEYLYKTKLYMKSLERFYKGVIWLFTSDTLPSEENSW
uniref:Uncharacterized protein n=1 Tax=Cryptomonas curvata TaxID=233186 RepID=A0A679CAU6_9CRYP|nr:hypothetical protein CcuCCAP97952_p151 [Cryptomonas curvata]